MRSETKAALLNLAGELEAAAVPFQLGGSGLLFALGLVERVGDLDIVFESGSQDRLRAVLGEMSGSAPDFDAAQEQDFVSDWRCTHELGGQRLDLTGGVTVRVAGRAIALPFVSGRSWEVEGVTIPLAPVPQWWLIYRIHGVPARAALLEGVAGPGSIATMLSALDLSPAAVP